METRTNYKNNTKQQREKEQAANWGQIIKITPNNKKKKLKVATGGQIIKKPKQQEKIPTRARIIKTTPIDVNKKATS